MQSRNLCLRVLGALGLSFFLPALLSYDLAVSRPLQNCKQPLSSRCLAGSTRLLGVGMLRFFLVPCQPGCQPFGAQQDTPLPSAEQKPGATSR